MMGSQRGRIAAGNGWLLRAAMPAAMIVSLPPIYSRHVSGNGVLQAAKLRDTVCIGVAHSGAKALVAA
jgi:hypothetical protein